MGQQNNELAQQTLSEQSRAQRAWSAVKNLQLLDRKKYGTLARGLPAMLQTNGLGQTLAFLKAKAKMQPKDISEHAAIYSHLSNWVMQQIFGGPDANKDLLEWIISKSSNEYRQATAEAIVFAMWLRRFAEAEGLTDSPQ